MATPSLTTLISDKLPDSPTPENRIKPADLRSILNEMLPQARTGTTVAFDRDADYAPLTSGTFTVDVTTTPIQPGVVVFVYLAAGTTAPSLPAGTFELVGGAYRTQVPLMFAFRVRSNTKIQYTITQLPS